MRLHLCPLIPAILLLALPAAPQEFTRDELDRLMAEKMAAEARLAALESAREITGADLSSLDQDLIAAAMESRRREEQATRAERRLIDLEARRQGIRQNLLRDRGSLDALLGALAMSASQRPPALVTAPDDASSAIRAAILMGSAAPRVKARTDDLAAELASLEAVERDLRRERARLEAAEAVLAEKKVEIERLAAAKRATFEDLSGETEALRNEVRRLSEQAGSLQQLLAGLEAIAPPAPRTKPAPPQTRTASLETPSVRTDTPRPDPLFNTARPLDNAALGGMQRPATGLLARRFGEKTPTGSTAEGLTIVTREEAQVVAPVDGRIVYAGEFRSYGVMLILSTSDGYHVILSGMAQIYGARDQWVAAGEPVGRMPARTQPPPELYLEVRKDQRALDPARWMKGS